MSDSYVNMMKRTKMYLLAGITLALIGIIVGCSEVSKFLEEIIALEPPAQDGDAGQNQDKPTPTPTKTPKPDATPTPYVTPTPAPFALSTSAPSL